MFSRTIQRIVPQYRRFVTSSFEKDSPDLAKFIKFYGYGAAVSSVYLSYVYFKNRILTRDEVRPFTGGLESMVNGGFISIIWPLSFTLTLARELDEIYIVYKKNCKNKK